MRSALLALLLAAAPSAFAQSDVDVAAYDAGYRAAEALRAGSQAFTFARYRDGFRAGLAADSSQIAFALGLQTGLQIQADTVTGIDPEAYLRGIEAGFAGSTPAFTPERVASASAVLQDSVTARQMRARSADPAFQARMAEARAAEAASEAFLAAAAQQPGATVSPTGVVSVVRTPGAGASPTTGSTVRVRYEGRFADGRVFDASPEGETVEFGVGGVVPGFSQALQQMKVGETRTIWIPSALAYGQRGAPGPNGGIPPNTALEFDLTLVEILPE